MAGEGRHDDVVFTGHSERRPKRFKPHRVLAQTFLGLLLAACGSPAEPSPTALSPQQAQATEQALLSDSARIESQLPAWFSSGVGEIVITSATPSGTSEPVSKGTVIVYAETSEYIDLMTAEHIGPFFWKTVTLNFPQGNEITSITVDARLGAPNWVEPTGEDWYIESVSKRSDPENGEYQPRFGLFE